MFFHALTFAGSRGSCLNTWPIFLHGLPYSTENAVETLKYSFSYTDFSKQNGVRCMLSYVITQSQGHSRMQHFREQKHWRYGQSGLQCFLYIMSCI